MDIVLFFDPLEKVGEGGKAFGGVGQLTLKSK